MAFVLRSQQDILKNILNEFRNSGISYLPKSSKAQAIARAISKEFDIAYRFFDSNFDSAFLSNASGSLLEALGTLFGISKNQSRKAFSTQYEQNVLFYPANGLNFGGINGGSSFTIPAGTIIQTPTRIQGAPVIQYQLTANVVCSAANTGVYAPVEALIEGSSQNVGRNSLLEHNFTSYTDSANSTLKVINRFAIVTGADIETENGFRQRISLASVASEGANTTALRFGLLSVPGIIDIRLIPYYNGIGTVGAFIVGQDNEASPTLLLFAQNALNRYAAAGEVVTAYAPSRAGVEFSTHVNLSEPVSAAQRSDINRKLINAAYSYVTNLVIGESIDLNRLIDVLQRTDVRIVNFGRDPTATQIDNLYLYRYSDHDNQRIRSSMLTTQRTLLIEQQEIIVPEFTITTPFTFTFDPTV